MYMNPLMQVRSAKTPWIRGALLVATLAACQASDAVRCLDQAPAETVCSVQWAVSSKSRGRRQEQAAERKNRKATPQGFETDLILISRNLGGVFR